MKDIGQGQSFVNFTLRNRIYIDKTEQISKLLKTDRVFISRPRRFGKSLMLDTIGTLFECGVEPYFKGTWIYDNWTEEQYPVLRLNFLKMSSSSFENFCEDFDAALAKFARRNGLEYVSQDLPMRSMEALLSSLETKKISIVILIDTKV